LNKSDRRFGLQSRCKIEQLEEGYLMMMLNQIEVGFLQLLEQRDQFQ
jgi:hypothetical protein